MRGKKIDEPGGIVVEVEVLRRAHNGLVGRFDHDFGEEHDGLRYCKCDLAVVIRAASIGDRPPAEVS